MTLDNLLRSLGGNLRANRLATAPLTLGLAALLAASSCAPYNSARAEGPEEQGQVAVEVTAQPDATQEAYVQPEESAISAPPQEPLGITDVLESNQIMTDVNQIQHIIDYTHEILAGQNLIVHEVPIKFLGEAEYQTEGLNKLGKKPGSGGFTYFVHDKSTPSGLKAEAIYVLAGRPFQDTMLTICNELTKPYAGEINGSKVIIEAAGLVAERACNRVLNEASGGTFDLYRNLKSMMNPARVRQLTRYYLVDEKPNIFLYATQAGWKRTNEMGLVEVLLRRNDGGLTIEESINANTLPNLSLVQSIIVKRLGGNRGPLIKEETKTVQDYWSGFSAP